MSRNLVANGHITAQSAQNLLRMMRAAFPEAEVTGYQVLIGSMLNDPKDRHVTAAAVRCGAQGIVTDNLGDFHESALAPFNLEAQSADTFLTHLFYLDPESVVDIIAKQAGEYSSPPMTALQLLGRIAEHAPGFANLVRVQSQRAGA